MRIAAAIGTEIVGRPAAPAELSEQVVRAEADGFASAWCPHFSRHVDALSVLAVAATRTERIRLGVSVVPTWPRHPVALAQQALTVQAFAAGRLTLGVGVSHRPVIEGMHGIAFTRPVAHMREYLTVLTALLDGGRAKLDGELFRVDAELTVPGALPVPVLVGALSPGMVTAAGELAGGVVTWLAGPRTLEREIVPRLRRVAAEAGRPPPQVVAGLPVTVHDDVAAARASVDAALGRYGGLANYRAVLDREGVASPGELAVVGDETEVTAQLERLAAAGVTELWPVPVGAGEDPAASVERTRRLLASLAPALTPG